MKKRLYNKFALAVMSLAFAFTSVSAYDFEAGGLYYNITSTSELTASVCGLADSSIVDLKIPSTVTYKSRTLKVTAIAEDAFRGKKIESLYVPSTISVISDDAFCYCDSLKSVNFAEGVQSLGKSCFEGCSSLRELRLPPNLKYFGDQVICGDPLIKKLVIPDSVTEIGFNNYEFLKSITFGTGSDGLPYIKYGRDAFDSMQKCENLEEIIIKDSEKNFHLSPFSGDKGERIPPFSNCDIKHYYVGRPLSGTEKYYNRYSREDKYKCKQGATGHIGLLEIAGGCKEVPYFYQRIDTLLLGERVSKFSARNICVDSLKLIRCKSITPPNLEDENYISQLTYANLPVYVPKGSLATYQAADGWKNFWEIREYDETTGISTVKTKPQETGHNYYDLQGRKLREPQKGINIIDGKKVLIK